MFGKPDWFCKQAGRQRIRPATWKGTIYRGGWLAAIALPALLLFASQRGPEAFVWLAASGGLFAWDWRQIKLGLRQPSGTEVADSEVLYIGDEDSPPVRVATANYRFASRRDG